MPSSSFIDGTFRPAGTAHPEPWHFRPKGEICFCSVGWKISPFGRNDRVNGDPGVSRKPPLQHPAALLARRREGPGALALRGFDDVIVATRVRAVPPAAFQALG